MSTTLLLAYGIIFLNLFRSVRIIKKVGEMMVIWSQREGGNLGLVESQWHLHILCRDMRFGIFN
jgi:hypothetical protein